jgi:DNA-directed RNA polymerase specialized sigma24 family protein
MLQSMTTASEGAEPLPKAAGVFATTHWSVVLAAGRSEDTQATDALEQLCRAYWYPLYAHVRRRGYSPEDAQDLTQEFFARLLAKQWLSMADERRGRFRSFLLAAFDHFLAKEWVRSHSQKRGGNHPHLSFELVAAEEWYRMGVGREGNPETFYERQWALRLLDRVREQLRAELAASGKADRFELLERFLPGEECALSYAEAAAQLDLPEGTFKSDVHRFRRRYGELLRQEIANTVGNPAEIDDELRHLIAVMGQ